MLINQSINGKLSGIGHIKTIGHVYDHVHDHIYSFGKHFHDYRACFGIVKNFIENRKWKFDTSKRK